MTVSENNVVAKKEGDYKSLCPVPLYTPDLVFYNSFKNDTDSIMDLLFLFQLNNR